MYPIHSALFACDLLLMKFLNYPRLACEPQTEINDGSHLLKLLAKLNLTYHYRKHLGIALFLSRIQQQ